MNVAVETHLIDLDRYIDETLSLIQQCESDIPGQYRRFRDPSIEADDPRPSPYGTSNAANLLYTFSAFPRERSRRDAMVEALQRGQDPESGLFPPPLASRSSSPHAFHSTAHCVAALELFDAAPRHPLFEMHGLRDPDAVRSFLESLDWAGNPWNESHRGAGVYASLKLAGGFDAPEAELAWENAYFRWIESQFDERTGLLRHGALPGAVPQSRPIHEHMAGTFHYLFNMEHARRPLPHPAAMVDSCLAMLQEDRCPDLGTRLGFVTIDWVYCLNRAVRQSGHRWGEARDAMWDVALRQIALMQSLDFGDPHEWGDLHRVFGTWCAWAELQRALPGRIRTRRPLRLVLDRRPFI